jgi:hypothetical protein
MSIAALNWAFSLRGVSVSQKVVLISLANFSDESGYSFPAIKTIAEMSCMSDSSVRRALVDLCEREILRIDHRFRADGSQTSSGYFLQLTPPVNLTPPPCTVAPPPITGDTPYNHQSTTTITDDKSSVANKRGTRISEDWQPSQDDYNQALQMGLTVEQVDNEANKFRDYWIGVPGAKGVKLNWSATWRNRCRDVVEWRSGKAGKPNPVRDDGKPQTFLGETLRLIKEREGYGNGG